MTKIEELGNRLLIEWEKGTLPNKKHKVVPLYTAAEICNMIMVCKAAEDLFDNRLGWSDGRNPYAPKELWKKLGDSLAMLREEQIT